MHRLEKDGYVAESKDGKKWSIINVLTDNEFDITNYPDTKAEDAFNIKVAWYKQHEIPALNRRIPRYVSPSAVSQFFQGRDEYYLRYCALDRPPKIEQSVAMAIGSAFDAYVKNYLYERFFGANDEYALETLLKKQVEDDDLRPKVSKIGQYVFDSYKHSGALANIALEIEKSGAEPEFEFEVRGNVNGIPMLGKPDLKFTVMVNGGQIVPVILDWKVNGYLSKSATSPAKGYVYVTDGFDHREYKASRNCNCSHPDAKLTYVNNICINTAHSIDVCSESWGGQLSLYSWVLGCEVGSDFICGIEQIVSTAKKDAYERPLLRVASYRGHVNKQFQLAYMSKIQEVWKAIQTGYFFTEMDKKSNDDRCAILNQMFKNYEGELSENDNWFNQITRGKQPFWQ